MAGSGLSQHTAHLTDYQDQDESFSVTHDTTVFVCSHQGRNHSIFIIFFILSFLISSILAIFQVYSHIEYSCGLCVNIIRHPTIATQINQQFCFVTKQATLHSDKTSYLTWILLTCLQWVPSMWSYG